MDNELFAMTGYSVISNSEYLERNFSDSVSDDLSKISDKIRKINRKTVDDVKRVIKRHPNVAMFRNILVSVYQTLEEIEKKTEENDRILELFPTNIRALSVRIELFCDNHQIEKATEIIGGKYNLKEHFPERKEFCMEEVRLFHLSLYKYALTIKDWDKALEQKDILFTMDSDEEIRAHFDLIFNEYYKTRNDSIVISVKSDKKTPKFSVKRTPPRLKHPEVHFLYQIEGDIEKGINTLLSLPRQSLIQDLILVLKDAELRYSILGENDWNYTVDSFPMVAILLLNELKAKESLPDILEFFRNEEQVLVHWFGEDYNSIMGNIIINLIEGEIEACSDFLFETGVNGDGKTYIIYALAGLAFLKPEYRDEVIELFSDLLYEFIEAKMSENFIDTLVTASLMDCCAGYELEELLPDLKKLYDMKRIDTKFVDDRLNEDYSYQFQVAEEKPLTEWINIIIRN